MPCYDGHLIEDNSAHYRSQISELQNQNNYLEACLCAVLTDINSRGLLDNVLATAQRDGNIDIVKFYNEHKNKDAERLKRDFLKRYSGHEIAMIKQLLDSSQLGGE